MNTSKLAVASELLDRALLMYYEGNSFFACIHLAGAAEEILGEYLLRQGQTPAFDYWSGDGVKLINLLDGAETWTPELMKNRLKYAKNRTKHMNSEGDSEILFEPKKECEEYLERAISNFYNLMNFIPVVETELIKRFNARRQQT